MTHQPCGLILIRWRQVQHVKTMDLKWVITEDRITEYKLSRTSSLLYITTRCILFASGFKCKQSSHTHTHTHAHIPTHTHTHTHHTHTHHTHTPTHTPHTHNHTHTTHTQPHTHHTHTPHTHTHTTHTTHTHTHTHITTIAGLQSCNLHLTRETAVHLDSVAALQRRA
jgi:hypothetical protein